MGSTTDGVRGMIEAPCRADVQREGPARCGVRHEGSVSCWIGAIATCEDPTPTDSVIMSYDFAEGE